MGALQLSAVVATTDRTFQLALVWTAPHPCDLQGARMYPEDNMEAVVPSCKRGVDQSAHITRSDVLNRAKSGDSRHPGPSWRRSLYVPCHMDSLRRVVANLYGFGLTRTLTTASSYWRGETSRRRNKSREFPAGTLGNNAYPALTTKAGYYTQRLVW